MAEMDQGIKRLIQTRPADVLALALPDVEYLGTQPIDVATEPQLVLDTLLRVRYHGYECVVDLEAEARPQKNMGRRLFEYGARANIVTKLPVISVVLYLEPDEKPVPSPYELYADDLLLAAWHFTAIELYRLLAEELFALDRPGLLPLIPFARDGKDFATIERAAEEIKVRAPGDQVKELEALLAVFAARTFSSDVLLELIRRIFMSNEILEQSSLYQLWVKQATERGIEQGVKQGIEQGVQQGVQQGVRREAAEAVRVVLRGRFGTLAPELDAAIGAADVERLHAVLARAATASEDELLALLREGQPQG
jgi:predicted transposase YdaD